MINMINAVKYISMATCKSAYISQMFISVMEPLIHNNNWFNTGKNPLRVFKFLMLLLLFFFTYSYSFFSKSNINSL